jgi:hypothetical protein
MTSRNATRYHRNFKNKTPKQSADNVDAAYRNASAKRARSDRAHVFLGLVLCALWAVALIWAIREVF